MSYDKKLNKSLIGKVLGVSIVDVIRIFSKFFYPNSVSLSVVFDTYDYAPPHLLFITIEHHSGEKDIEINEPQLAVEENKGGEFKIKPSELRFPLKLKKREDRKQLKFESNIKKISEGHNKLIFSIYFNSVGEKKKKRSFSVDISKGSISKNDRKLQILEVKNSRWNIFKYFN